MATPNTQPTTPREMPAKFPGRCSACGLPFPAGTPILWRPGDTRHKECPQAAPQAPSTQEAPTFYAARRGRLYGGEFYGATWLYPSDGECREFDRVRLCDGTGYYAWNWTPKRRAWYVRASVELDVLQRAFGEAARVIPLSAETRQAWKASRGW